MRTRRFVIGVVIIFCTLALGGVYYLIKNRTSDDGSEGIPAPEFSFPDASGNLVSLEEVNATIKIVNLWASWSPYSTEELRMFDRVRSEYAPNVAVIALSRDSVPEDGMEFVRREGLEGEIRFVFDEQDSYYKKVSGYAVPETLFLNSEGNIIFHKHGPITYEETVAIVESELRDHAGN